MAVGVLIRLGNKSKVGIDAITTPTHGIGRWKILNIIKRPKEGNLGGALGVGLQSDVH